METLKLRCAWLKLMIKQKYLVLVKKIKMIRITQEQYFLNSTQPFLDSEINSKKLDLWTLKQDKYLILYIIGLSHLPVLSVGRLQNNQHHLMFLSGSGGCGKSHLIKTDFHAVRYFCIEVVTQLNLEFYYLHQQVLLALTVAIQCILVCMYHV